MEDIKCPKCNAINLATVKFCQQCGTTLEKTNVMEENKCLECGIINLSTAKFCKNCGIPIKKVDIAVEDVDLKREIPVEAVEKEEIKDYILEEQEPLAEIKKASKIKKLEKSPVFYQIFFPVASFFLTVVLLGVVSIIFSPGSFGYRLFLPAGGWYIKVVPFIIVFLSIWSLFQLISKLRDVRKEEKGLEENIILNLPQSIHEEGVKVTVEKLSSHKKEFKETKLFKRIFSLLEHLDTTDDIQRSHEFFRHQFEIDSDTATSGYTIVRLFIWAMPILGFIGTVVGIGLAVGNFSSFLTGDIENIEVVKKELSKVSSGLSYAFDTTLLGLVASLLTMLLTSFVQNREEGFLTELESLCLKIISKFKTEQPLIPDKATNDLVVGSIDYLKSFQKELRLLTDELSGNLKVFTNSFSATSQELSKEFAELPIKLQKEGKDIKEVISDLQKFSQVLGSILENTNKQFKESFEESFARLSSHVEPLHSTLNANIQTINTLNSFNQILNEMQRTLSSLTPLLSRLSGPLELRLFPSQQEGVSSERAINPKPPE